MKKKRLVQVIILLLALALLGQVLGVWSNFMWFSSLGYNKVFWTLFLTRFAVGATVFIVFFAFFQINFRYLRRSIPPYQVIDMHTRIYEVFISPLRRIFSSKGGKILFTGFNALLALLFAVSISSQWEVFQKFFYAVPFGQVDPIMGKDAGFYIFKLPFYELLQSSLTSAVILMLIICGLIYFFLASSEFLKGGWRVFSPVKLHLASLIAGFLVLKAWDYYLSIYNLLASGQGSFFGAGFTDVHARIPALKILAVLAVVAAVLVFVSLLRGKVLPIATGVGVLVVASLLLGGVYPFAVQKFQVEPNEFSREKKYIEYNIAATRYAYGLEGVKPVSVIKEEAEETGKDVIEKNRTTLSNIRLWDFRPIQQVYNQMQQLRRYYSFHDVNVDRYNLGDDYRQVMISVRELNQDKLSERARTWMNRRLQYTHGYGAVVSPVNEVTAEGRPLYLLENIPPQTTFPELKVDRPEIYYGELTDNIVVVNTKIGEFDYPSGEKNIYCSYQGSGGVQLTPFRRFLYALHFKDMRLLLSSDITSESRILYQRTVQDARRLAPYLRFDSDPYPVIVDGRIYWILDAYTAANYYPYSDLREGINYIRNSVKVVVDAYNGEYTFYVSDPTDPVVETYSKIYPGLYRPLSEMPVSLQQHLRYPVDLFKLQSEVFAEYHVQDARVFYNREDEWSIPHEKFSDESQEIEPYYTMMKLSGEEKEEFMLILPFTPVNRENAVAWLAARCDGGHYGEMVVDIFPKDVHVYGPMQVEASIDQDGEISSQLTLWNQHGSQVIRGNLITVPLAGKLLYVEPLFLQAKESAMPELTRVIAFYDGRVVMERDLWSALNKLFGVEDGTPAPSPQPDDADIVPQDQDIDELAKKANQLYQEANKALKAGDWAGYGKAIDELGKVLDEML
ncbi:MAG: UPF0182 family protein [Syntrophaceticus sp.]